LAKLDHNSHAAPQPSRQQRLEALGVRLAVAAIGVLPRSAARAVGAGIGALLFHLLGRLRRTGMENLRRSFPEKSEAERVRILRGVYRSLGWQLGEFCKMRGYTAAQASTFIRYDGLEHYLAARDKGRGVLVLTGHLGAWELSSYYHSQMGYPMSMVIRRLDNPLVDAFVNDLRCLHGNRVIHKDDFARGLLAAMHHGDTVGILMDTNMTPPQGVFVPASRSTPARPSFQVSCCGKRVSSATTFASVRRSSSSTAAMQPTISSPIPLSSRQPSSPM
jgi:KDO2-lipid IV(A) lauroyltransferase